MFGLELIKYKRNLTQNFSSCFALLKDALGNVPIAIQNDAFINGAIVHICESYLDEQKINKRYSKALVIDAVFEEIYRRESVKVQIQVDLWRQTNNSLFLLGFNRTNTLTGHHMKLQWLSDYARCHFEPANNLLL